MAAAPAASVSATCRSPGKLHTEGLATLPFDLLTEHEAYDRRNVFEIAMLGGRMVDAIRFARSDPELSRFPIGLFGASTGAAAALVASAEMLQDVSVVLSRGGRPDLAGGALPHIHAATLLFVGGNDDAVLKLNRRAFNACEKRLNIVPGATHLFEEPGALDKVVELAGDWFNSHFDAIAPAGVTQTPSCSLFREAGIPVVAGIACVLEAPGSRVRSVSHVDWSWRWWLKS
jgi:hypothetical protein